jgi:hypothetical protein
LRIIVQGSASKTHGTNLDVLVFFVDERFEAFLHDIVDLCARARKLSLS